MISNFHSAKILQSGIDENDIVFGQNGNRNWMWLHWDIVESPWKYRASEPKSLFVTAEQEKLSEFPMHFGHYWTKIGQIACLSGIWYTVIPRYSDSFRQQTKSHYHTASKWTFTEKKCKSNFEHIPRNFIPSGPQNRFQINPRRSSEREIAILSFSLFSESSIFQLEKLSTKTFLMNSIWLLFYFW